MFDLRFENDSISKIIDGVPYKKGFIQIAEFKELFMSPLSFWHEQNYVNHWSKNISSFILYGLDKTFLITEMYDPKNANFIKWWILYRKRCEVVFHEQILFLDEMDFDFSLDSAFLCIPRYQRINEDGEEISEWVLSLSAFKQNVILKKYY